MSHPLRRRLLVWTLCVLLWVAEEGAAPERAFASDPPALIAHPYEVLEVYLKPEEALKLAFPTSERFDAEEVRLTAEQAARVAALADHPLWEETFTVYKATTHGRAEGYAVVTEEVGKFHLITFLVAVTPDGAVRRVEVLVYRESRGGEVRQRRFLHQYEGKSLRDPIRLNRDIRNVTGATLSVRAISRGVRKALGVIREAYLQAG
jgi:hypothetical protein